MRCKGVICFALGVVTAFALSLRGLSMEASAQTPEPLLEAIVQLGPTVGRSVGIFSKQPTGWSKPSSTSVLAFGNYYGVQSGEAVYARAYLWFPLPPVPQGYVLSEAVLAVHTLDEQPWPFEGEASFGLYRVLAAWDEGMTWDSRPPVDSQSLAQTVVSSAGGVQWVQWDVTALVTAWLEGAVPNHGVLIAAVPVPDAPPDQSGNWAVAAHGRMITDTALAPRLALRYALAPTPTPTFTSTPQPPTSTPQPPTSTPRPPVPPPPSPTPTPTPVIALLPMTGARWYTPMAKWPCLWR